MKRKTTIFQGVCDRARRGLTCISFPPYSVVCTIDSLSLCFISLLYLDLYVLGYDTSIS